MNRNGLLLVPLLAAAFYAGCNGEETKNKKLLDTGWFTDTADFDPETCLHRIHSFFPDRGEDQWYWRSFPIVYTETHAEQFYDAHLYGPSGKEVKVKLKWHPTGNRFDVKFNGGLEPNGEYRLVASDCSGKDQTIRFGVSSTGLPLKDGPRSLTRRTYEVHMRDAIWDEPPGLGSLVTLYFTVPIVLGVQLANDNTLDLLGGVGGKSGGTIVQDFNEPTWDFPITDFTEHPYFSAKANKIELRFQDSRVPVFDFSISATFAPDGGSFSGGHIAGIADTRHMGALVNDPGNKRGVCALTKEFGVDCIPCPNGGDYCLQMTLRDTTGTWIPGLVLVEND